MYTVLEGIDAGELTLIYCRWQNYRGRRDGGEKGEPMLGIVYWIGSTIGTLPGASIYRDAVHAAKDVIDKYVVFNLHFANDEDMFKLVKKTGQMTAGMKEISACHGQFSETPRG